MNDFNGILEDVTKANLEQLVGKIMTLAVEKGCYEFVPGYFLCDNNWLIEHQKNGNSIIKNIKDIDFSILDFWIMNISTPTLGQTAVINIAPCRDPLDIAEVILMTEGRGNEAEG